MPLADIKFNENELLNFIKLKKTAKFESVQMYAAMFCIAAAFISNLFDKSLTSAFLVGAFFLISACLPQVSTKQLIRLIDTLIGSDAASFRKMTDLKQP